MLSYTRRTMLVGALALAFIPPSLAAERVAFDQAAFEVAQAAGEPILVHVTADWCEVCQAQKPIVAELTAKPEFSGMKVYNVDFDAQKDVLRNFRVQFQSTMIVFKGSTETGRSTGETDPAVIEALLKGAN
jgi:thiol-disulfide isomerase/thioredoxin